MRVRAQHWAELSRAGTLIGPHDLVDVPSTGVSFMRRDVGPPGRPGLKTRAATEGDAEFLAELACRAYRDVVTRQFGTWDENDQATRFAAKVARLPFEVGAYAGERMAAVSSSVHADHVFLNDVLALPESQDRGFGGFLLEREIARARRAARSLQRRWHALAP